MGKLSNAIQIARNAHKILQVRLFIFKYQINKEEEQLRKYFLII